MIFLHAPEFFEKMETQEVRGNFPEPEMQRIQFLQEWQRYWIRIGIQLTDSQRLKKPQDSSENEKDKKENPEPEKKEPKSRGQHRKEAR